MWRFLHPVIFPSLDRPTNIKPPSGIVLLHMEKYSLRSLGAIRALFRSILAELAKEVLVESPEYFFRR
jgi:hypothetical protein